MRAPSRLSQAAGTGATLALLCTARAGTVLDRSSQAAPRSGRVQVHGAVAVCAADGWLNANVPYFWLSRRSVAFFRRGPRPVLVRKELPSGRERTLARLTRAFGIGPDTQGTVQISPGGRYALFDTFGGPTIVATPDGNPVARWTTGDGLYGAVTRWLPGGRRWLEFSAGELTGGDYRTVTAHAVKRPRENRAYAVSSTGNFYLSDANVESVGITACGDVLAVDWNARYTKPVPFLVLWTAHLGRSLFPCLRSVIPLPARTRLVNLWFSPRGDDLLLYLWRGQWSVDSPPGHHGHASSGGPPLPSQATLWVCGLDRHWLRQVVEVPARADVNPDNVLGSVAWQPDGRHVSFLHAGRLWVAPAERAQAAARATAYGATGLRRIAVPPACGVCLLHCWAAGGLILLDRRLGALVLLRARGRPRVLRRLTRVLGLRRDSAGALRASPDAHALLYNPLDGARLRVATVSGRRLVAWRAPAGTAAVWFADSRRVGLVAEGPAAGECDRLIERDSRRPRWRRVLRAAADLPTSTPPFDSMGLSDIRRSALTRHGRMVTVPWSGHVSASRRAAVAHITWRPRTGTARLTPVSLPAGSWLLDFAVAPAGDRIAWLVWRGAGSRDAEGGLQRGRAEIWVGSAGGGAPRRVAWISPLTAPECSAPADLTWTDGGHGVAFRFNGAFYLASAGGRVALRQVPEGHRASAREAGRLCWGF